jgi:hypothetical protein
MKRYAIQICDRVAIQRGQSVCDARIHGAPNDPVPPEGVTDVGQKQDAAIKNELPG